MEFLTETARRTPPLIIMRGTQFNVCGSGYDTHLWLKPKIMRQSNAYIIHDPDGSLLKHHGRSFNRNGYAVKVLNLAKIKISTRYNPLEYIRSYSGAVKFVTALMSGTKGSGQPRDINFISAETMLLTALVTYLHDEARSDEKNMNTLMLMLKYMLPEDDADYEYKHAIDFIMEDKEKCDPEHLSVRLYNNFNDMMGTDAKGVVESCIARLAPFDTDEMRDFLSDDEIGLDSLHFPNTALFVISGSTGEAFKFIAPLMYSQFFDVMCEKCVQ